MQHRAGNDAKQPGYEVPSSRSSAGFRDGQNVDIVGVTGSIPVTPTIQINHLAEKYEVATRFNKPNVMMPPEFSTNKQEGAAER